MAAAMRSPMVAENSAHSSSDDSARSALGARKASAISVSPKPAAASVCAGRISPRAHKAGSSRSSA